MKSLDLIAASMIFLVLTGVPAMAHHSATYFDMDMEVAHKNVTVVDFQVANPHGILVYAVIDADGHETEWNAELPSANFTRRAGIDELALKPGDTLTVIGWPGRPGRTREKIIRLNRAEFSNGDVATFTAISATLIRTGTE